MAQAQPFIAAVLALFPAFGHALSPAQIAAIEGVAAAFAAWVAAWNAVEDHSGKALLKTPPVPDARRRRDPFGH